MSPLFLENWQQDFAGLCVDIAGESSKMAARGVGGDGSIQGDLSKFPRPEDVLHASFEDVGDI